MKRGDKGSDVDRLQTALNAAGPFPPLVDLVVDGIFGPLTETALLAFQSKVGLPATGVADDRTWAALGYMAADASSKWTWGKTAATGVTLALVTKLLRWW